MGVTEDEGIIERKRVCVRRRQLKRKAGVMKKERGEMRGRKMRAMICRIVQRAFIDRREGVCSGVLRKIASVC